MKSAVWVVGSGGLLGSAVARILGSDLFSCGPLPWGERDAAEAALRHAVREFAGIAEASPQWVVYWCAGAGVVGTPGVALEAETSTFAFFLKELATALRERRVSSPGVVFLASSAGGVYGRCPDRPITEASAALPVSDYGRAKLAQEGILEAWTRDTPGVSAVIGRFSNLYGPGQHLGKNQGLISHMSRCAVRGVPVHIFVPLDTSRDFLFSEDAARIAVACVERARSAAPSSVAIRIIASEVPTSLATLVALFEKATRKRLRIIAGSLSASHQQAARHCFRSTLWRDLSRRGTPLTEGIQRVHRHQISTFLQGHLSRSHDPARA